MSDALLVEALAETTKVLLCTCPYSSCDSAVANQGIVSWVAIMCGLLPRAISISPKAKAKRCGARRQMLRSSIISKGKQSSPPLL